MMVMPIDCYNTTYYSNYQRIPTVTRSSSKKERLVVLRRRSLPFLLSLLSLVSLTTTTKIKMICNAFHMNRININYSNRMQMVLSQSKRRHQQRQYPTTNLSLFRQDDDNRRSTRGSRYSINSRQYSTTTRMRTTAISSIEGSSPSSSNSVLVSALPSVSLKHIEFSTHQQQQPETTTKKSTTSKSPVIFLHGLLGNKRNFATIGRSLNIQLQHQRKIYGLDLRNHGDNHHDWRDDMTYQSMAQDVIHFLDTNHIEKVELIGHSVGGKVAQAVALLRPDRVDGLVVIDIAPVTYTDDEPHWKAVVDIIDALSSTTLQPGLSKRDVDIQLQSTIADPALRAFCLTNYDPKLGQWTVHLDSIASQLETLAGFDIIPDCDKNDNSFCYSGDAFFIHGGQSRFVRHKHIDTIANHFPNDMLTTIRGAGHWVHAEAPEDTTALLKKFLDR